MPIARYIEDSEKDSSWIRRMFEKGLELQKKHGAGKIADFSIGNPNLEPPKEFTEALRAHIDDKDLHRYMPNAGFPDVREKISAWLEKKYKMRFGLQNVTMTCGAAGAMNVALKTVLNPGEEALLLEPWFCEYKFYIENHGGKAVIAKTKENFDLDFEELDSKIGKNTRALILNSPNNPTGKVYTEKELKKLAALLEEKQNEFNSQIYVLSDEPYREIVFGCEAPSIVPFYPNSFMAYSWSKSLGIPGERIGYLAVNPEIDDKRIAEKLAFSTRILGFVNAPALLQKAVADVLDAKVNVEIYRKHRDKIAGALEKAGYDFTLPQGAFYFFPKSPLPNEIEFIDKAAEKLVLLTPGTGFGRQGYFRLSYAVSEQTIDLGLEKLGELMEELE
ncbi:MAG: pyridoxal phosphate-dependent aminotransferase [Candidatus Diapherotrites archaeon]|nr:pyridoxal phosphate-dependent aminotransferase [Candidatus Diapherotrites archaeon]